MPRRLLCSRWLTPLGICAALHGGIASAAFRAATTQDVVAVPESEIEALIQTARTAAPHIRPQAAERLLGLGATAAAALREVLEEQQSSPQALGSDLMEVLACFGDEYLRGVAWQVLQDADFPWRPAAARSLARTIQAEEHERVRAWLLDPLPAVRSAGLLALKELDAQAERELVRLRLADENDRVRRDAAVLLDRWGEPGALAWLVEELGRDDRFFRLPAGKLARLEAARLLTERLGDLAGFRAEGDPQSAENQAARSILRQRVEQLAGVELPVLPGVARVGSLAQADCIGLEIRSCRRGELFLRWNAADQLLIGLGNPTAIALAPGSSARLNQAIAHLLPELGDQKSFGQPGCDLEQFHWQPTPDQKVRSWVVSKGPEPVSNLRPAALTKIYQALLASLEAATEAALVEELRLRLLEALAAVGGGLTGS